MLYQLSYFRIFSKKIELLFHIPLPRLGTLFLLWQGYALPTELFPHIFKKIELLFRIPSPRLETLFLLRQGYALPTELFPHLLHQTFLAFRLTGAKVVQKS